MVVPFSSTANLSLSVGFAPSACKCAQTSSILRNNYNPSSVAWSLPPTTYKSLSFPSPQISWILVYTHLSIFSLPIHASVLSNPNFAPYCFSRIAFAEVTSDFHIAKAKGNFSVLILISHHLTQSTTPSFLKHSLEYILLYSVIVCSFSQPLQSTQPSNTDIPQGLILELLSSPSTLSPSDTCSFGFIYFWISATPIFLSVAKASLFWVSGLPQSQNQLPVLCFICSVSEPLSMSKTIYNLFCQTCFSPVLVNGLSQRPRHNPLFLLFLYSYPFPHPFFHQVLSFWAPK